MEKKQEQKTGVVGFNVVTSTHLGDHQQLYHMAHAACHTLGIDIETASPLEIQSAIGSLRARVLRYREMCSGLCQDVIKAEGGAK